MYTSTIYLSTAALSVHQYTSLPHKALEQMGRDHDADKASVWLSISNIKRETCAIEMKLNWLQY